MISLATLSTRSSIPLPIANHAVIVGLRPTAPHELSCLGVDDVDEQRVPCSYWMAPDMRARTFLSVNKIS